MATLRLPHVDRSGPHPRFDWLRAAFWVIAGTLVFAFILVFALGAVDPGEVKALTAVVCVLAVLWAAHEWRQLWADESVWRPRGD